MGRFGNDNHAALDKPAQGDLGYALAVFTADFGQQRIRKETVASFGERSPRHDARTELLHDPLRLDLLVENMRLYLIHGRNDLHITGQIDEVVGIEIRNADSTQFTLFVSLFQCAVCPVTVAERLVQQYQVDIVRLQFTQALVDRSFRFFIPVVRYPHFRHEENFLAVDTAFADGISYAFFVVVCLCRVDHTIACL